MAHLGFTRTVYKSGSQGKAAARMEYLTGRAVEESGQAEAQLDYISGGREDLVEVGTRNLPAWAGNALSYFAAAERYEGKKRVAFEEWKITLPYELSREQNKALVRDLLDVIAGESLPCTYAFHEPRTLHGDRPQPHIHLLISARRTDAYPRSAATHFKLWQARAPGTGGAQKEPAMNTKGAVKLHRLMIADILNLHLEGHGHVARVHPDTLKARGIDRQPEPKMSPGESRAYREGGVKTARVQQVLAMRQARAAQPPREQNNARAYWEERKAFLGVTRDMPQAQKLAQILLRRHGSVARVPARYRPALQRSQERLPDLVRQLQQHARHLMADEEAAHGVLHIRLHDQAQQWGR